MSGKVGILAYGSLIGDPGEEIERARIGTVDGVLTPFRVEFARKSRCRGGAPTLVPVGDGGARVLGQVFVLNTPENEGADCLWRREINQVGSGRTYKAPKNIGPDHVVVRRRKNFAGIDVVLYTEIAANIEPLTAANLARLAIESVNKSEPGRDGISYLIAAKRNGIKTALSRDYEAEILRLSECADLTEALMRLRR